MLALPDNRFLPDIQRIAEFVLVDRACEALGFQYGSDELLAKLPRLSEQNP